MDTGLQCLNCGKLVDQDKAKLFAQVFVCPECFLLAERKYQRMEQELKRLLMLAHEAIRESLIQGKLHPTFEDGAGGDVPKEELIRSLVQGTGQKK